MLGPQWEESGMLCAQQSAAASRKPLMPPHRVQSACSTVTACGIEHGAEIPGSVPVLTGGDVHPEWGPLAHLIQTDEMIGADRLFEPAHIILAEAVRQIDRLGDGVGAVGVDEKIAFRAQSPARATRTRAGSWSGWVPIFILTLVNPSLAHPPELI